jgi:hypothetical protein
MRKKKNLWEEKKGGIFKKTCAAPTPHLGPFFRESDLLTDLDFLG